MGRAKQRMELISNEKSRFVTFKNRKKGLLKKASELKTLCDVQLCVIIYGPQADHQPVKPELWPANTDEIKFLMDSYQKQSTEDRCRKTVDIFTFFEDRKQKIEDEINKLRKRNEEARYTKWDGRYDALSKEQLLQLDGELEGRITDLKAKVERMKRNNFYNGVAHMDPPNMMMMMNDNYQYHHHPYFMYNHVMDRGLGSYDHSLMMMMGQKNLPHFNNDLGHHKQLNGPDSQQVLPQWQYMQPQMGLPQIGLTHFYPTNLGQYDKTM